MGTEMINSGREWDWMDKENPKNMECDNCNEEWTNHNGHDDEEDEDS